MAKDRPKPTVLSEYCKACGRCIEACAKHCISPGEALHPLTGFAPITISLEDCNGCGLCFAACPEPHGLEPIGGEVDALVGLAGRKEVFKAAIEPIPDAVVPLPESEPLVIKGTYASAIGALLAGCRHFYGYPITPSTDGAELMAKLLPKLDGVFIQAVSEVTTVNIMYGCGGAGLRSMTFTSSPGFSLMLEGLSYMVGAEVPGVFVNVMRGGPGLGNIGPEQSDIKLACRGLGHGNSHCPVLAPATPQEMLDLTMLAFEMAFKYRTPVVVLGDGYLGQMTGKVRLPDHLVRPGLPSWAVYGDAPHRPNLITSFNLAEPDLEAHNLDLIAKYERIQAAEQRADTWMCDDADTVIVACNSPAQTAKGAIRELRSRGVKAGLFRPISLWPFPIDALRPVVAHAKRIVVVEAGYGQLEDELRLALSHAGIAPPPITHVRRYGGILPGMHEIVEVAA